MECAHSSERPFACAQCDFRAGTEAELIEHGQIHTAGYFYFFFSSVQLLH